MPDKIDYKFISILEGGCRATGYIAPGKVGGVNIACGVDLGNCSEAILRSHGLSPMLINKLKPFLGKNGAEAQNLLKVNSLILTAAEAAAIDKAARQDHIHSLRAEYQTSPDNAHQTDFFDLPAEAQTVIASVSHQHGVNLAATAPAFWASVCAQDWSKTINSLMEFGDTHPMRRQQEAHLLENIPSS